MKTFAEVIERGSKLLGLEESLLEMDLSNVENLEESLDELEVLAEAWKLPFGIKLPNKKNAPKVGKEPEYPDRDKYTPPDYQKAYDQYYKDKEAHRDSEYTARVHRQAAEDIHSGLRRHGFGDKSTWNKVDQISPKALNTYTDTPEGRAHGSNTSVFAMHHKGTGTKLLGYYSDRRGDSGFKIHDVTDPSNSKHVGTFGTVKALHTHLDKYVPGVTSKDYEYHVGTRDGSILDKQKLGHGRWNKETSDAAAGRDTSYWGSKKSTGLSGDKVRDFIRGKAFATVSHSHLSSMNHLNKAVGKLNDMIANPKGSKYNDDNELGKHISSIENHLKKLKSMSSATNYEFKKDRYTRNEYASALKQSRGQGR